VITLATRNLGKAGCATTGMVRSDSILRDILADARDRR
jgi:hypothetical protein